MNHQKRKRIIAAVMAVVLVFSCVFTTGLFDRGVKAASTLPDEKPVPEVLESASAVNYATILNRATDFGITARKFEQNNHMETTLAVIDFINPDGGNNNDVDLITGTAQFLFAGLDLEGKYETKSYIRLGANTTDTVNIEASSEVFEGYNDPYTSPYKTSYNSGYNGNFIFDNPFFANKPDIVTVPSGPNVTAANIELILGDAGRSSDELSAAANDPKRVLDYKAYSTQDGAHIYFNFNYDVFKNKVVYINADTDLAKYFSYDGGVCIIKDDSTVIVFNVEDGIVNQYDDSLLLMPISVSIDNGANYSNCTTGFGDPNNTHVDRHINQKIIWNIRSSGKIKINTIAGTTLIPNKNSEVDVVGSSTGWLVSNGYVTNHAEWHYVYSGGNQDVLSDGVNQIHFALRKRFTKLYDGADTEMDRTVESNAGDYTFNWYETDSEFNTDGLTPVQVSNTATNTAKFPILQFYANEQQPVYADVPRTGTETIKDDFSVADMNWFGSVYKQGSFAGLPAALNENPDYVKLSIVYYDDYDDNSGTVVRTDLQINATDANGQYAEISQISTPKTWWANYEIKGTDLLNALKAANPNFDTTNVVRVGINAYNNLNFNGPFYTRAYTYYETIIDHFETINDAQRPYYVSNGTSKDFYYYINEVNAGNSFIFGENKITNSTGDIKIKLTVTNTNGVLSYLVNSVTTLGDGSVFRTENNIKMSGVEFTLGAFFNLVTNDETGVLKIEKEFEGNLTTEDKNAALSHLSFEIAKKTGEKVEGSPFKIASADSNGKYILNVTLPEGEYTVREVIDENALTRIGNSLYFGNNNAIYLLNADTSVKSVELEKGKQKSVSFANNYTKQTATLSLNKTLSYPQTPRVAGNTFDENSAYAGIDFNVTGTDILGNSFSKTVSGTDVKNSTGGIYTFDVNPGTYSVTETFGNVSGYSNSSVTYSGIVSGTGVKADFSLTNGQTALLSYVNTYTDEAGSLAVKKIFAGDYSNASAADKEAALTKLKFEIYKDGSLIKTIEGSTMKAANNYTSAVVNLAPGTYVVKEVKLSDINEYKVTLDSDKTVVIDDNDAKTAEFTNTYSRNHGKITLTKTIKGNVTKEEAEGALKFEIKLGSNTWIDKNGDKSSTPVTITLGDFSNVVVNGDGTMTYSHDLNVESNTGYTVKETVTDIEGNVLISQKYSVNGGEAVTGDTTPAFNVEDGKTSTVAYENVYSDKGILVVEKTISGDLTEEEINGNLRFEITTGSGNSVKWLKADGTLSDQKVEHIIGSLGSAFVQDTVNKNKYVMTITGVTKGTYTVTETAYTVDGYVATVKNSTYDNNGSLIASSQTNSGSVEVFAEKQTTAAYEDDYELNKGSIVITKTIKGDITKDEAEGALRFEVTTKVTENGVEVTKYLKKDGTLTDDKTEYKLSDFTLENGKYTLTIEKAPVGNYNVCETIYDVDGYVATVKNTVYKDNTKVSSADSNGASVSVVLGKKETAKVEYEDDYEANAGKIVIEKTIEGDITKEEAEGALRFEVTTKVTENGVEVTKYLKKDGTLTDDKTEYKLSDFTLENGKYTLEIVAPAGEYNVCETIYDVNGYSVTVKNTVYKDNNKVSSADSNGASATVNLEKGQTYVVDYNDAYVRDKGSLVITKVLEGDVSKEEAEDGITFTVVNSEGKFLKKDGSVSGETVTYTLKDFTLGADGKTYTLEFTGDSKLVTDTYTVTETNSAIKGYKETVSYKINSEEEVTGKEATVEVTKGSENLVVIKDLYKELPDIIIHVTDKETGDDIEGATVEITKPDGTTIVVKTDNNGYAVVEDVDDGDYTIEVKEVPDGYTVEGDSSETVEIDGTKDIDLEFNITTAGGTLVIEKTITGALTEEEINGNLKFEITTGSGDSIKWLKADGTLSDQKVEHIIGGSDSAFVQDATDKNKYVMTITNVAGGTYTVTETAYDVDGYVAAVKNSTYDNDGNLIASTDGAVSSVDVLSQKTTTAAYEDAYEENVGKVVITKTIDGDITREEAEGALRFEVTTKVTENGTEVTKYLKKDGTLTDDKTEYTLSDFTLENGKYTLTIDKAPVGNYNVCETIYDVEGRVATVKNTVYKDNTKVSSADSNGASAYVVLGLKEIVKVAYEDIYETNAGKIVITKTIEGDITKEEAEGALRFEVTTKVTENGTEVTKYLKKDGTLTDDKTEYTLSDFTSENGKYTLEIVAPVGDYNVCETIYDVNGYAVTVKNTVYKDNNKVSSADKDGASIDVNLEKGQTYVVDYEDVYVRDKGSLVITKVLEGDVTKEEAEGGIEFTVVNSEGKYLKKDGSVSDETVTYTLKDFTIGTDGKTYTLEFTGDSELVTDTYTVTETNSAIKGYKETVSYKINSEEEVTGKEATVEVTKGSENLVVIKDLYKELPDITVHVTDKRTGDDIEGATIEITKPDGTTIVVKTDSNGYVVVEDVEEGDYDIVIIEVPEGYTVVDGGEQKVTIDGSDDVDIESTITSSGGLLIVVEDEKTGERVPGAVVEVTEPNGETKIFTTNENGEIDEYTAKDDDGLYIAEAGEYTIKVLEVPDGYEVTIGESDTEYVIAGAVREYVAKINTNTTPDPDFELDDANTTPNTGDSAQLCFMMIMLMISMAGICVAAKKKEN